MNFTPKREKLTEGKKTVSNINSLTDCVDYLILITHKRLDYSLPDML